MTKEARTRRAAPPGRNTGEPGSGEAASAAPPFPAPARLADAAVPPEVLARLERIAPEIARTREAVAEGRPAGESEERLERFAQREREKRTAALKASRRAVADTDAALERVLGKDDILLIGFLLAGLHAARSVGRIRIDTPEGTRHGTGFLVSPSMVLTNNHVLGTEGEAVGARIDFETFGITGEPLSTTTCDLDPGRLFFTSEELDFSVISLVDTPAAHVSTARLGWHPMVGQEGKIRIGDPVNIIQYPGGQLKSVVLHNSNLMHLENDSDLHPFCWYTSDTERGSSGAPVFNNRWEVIGVHHKSIPKTDENGNILATDMTIMTREEFRRNPDRALFWANEGTRTSRIVDALGKWTPPTDDTRMARDKLLALWKSARLRNLGQDAAREGARDEYSPTSARAGAEALASAPVRLEGAGSTINLHFHFSKA